MLKRIITLILLTVNLVVLSQKQVTEFKNASEKLNNLSAVINSKTNETLFLSTDNKNIHGYLFDQDFKLLKQVQAKKEKKYTILLGYKILNNNEYIIYLSNKKLNKFKRIKFNIDSSKSESNEFTLLRDYETVLQTVSTNNNFYLISTSKAVNNMYIYTFDFDKSPVRNTIDFSGITFLNHLGKPERLMNILVKDEALSEKETLLKYTDGFPSDIKTTIEKRKLYVKDNKILISLDNYTNETQIISINLNNLKATYKSVKKPLQDVKRNKKLSNSYIQKNKIYTFAASRKKAEFIVKDLESDSLIYNSFIHLEGKILNKKGFENISDYKEAKRFLLHDYTLGINPIKKDSNVFIELAIGSLKKGVPSFDKTLSSPVLSNQVSYFDISEENLFFDAIQHHFDAKSEGYFLYNKTDFVLNSEFKETSLNHENVIDTINKDFYSTNRIVKVYELFRKRKHLKDVIFKLNNSYIFSFYHEKSNSIKLYEYKE